MIVGTQRLCGEGEKSKLERMCVCVCVIGNVSMLRVILLAVSEIVLHEGIFLAIECVYSSIGQNKKNM